MEHDEFIAEVQQRARLRSSADAERATQAVLETVAEHMSGGTALQLASRLPEEIGDHIRRTARNPIVGEPVAEFDTFFRSVSDREGVDRSTAVFHSRVVLEIVKEASTVRVRNAAALSASWMGFRGI